MNIKATGYNGVTTVFYKKSRVKKALALNRKSELNDTSYQLFNYVSINVFVVET